MATKYRVSAQMYGFREFIQTPKDMLKTIQRVKKMGYDYQQVSGYGPICPKELKKMSDGEGVQIIGTHVGLGELRTDAAKVINDVLLLGCKYAAIPWLNIGDYKTSADWKGLFREFNVYQKKFAKAGIILQYHNHMFEFEKFGIKNGAGGKTILDMFLETCKGIQAELDVGWVARGGYDPIAWVKKFSGRLDQVHFKDWGVVNNAPVWRAVGEGSLDWPGIIKACKAAGTIDFIVEQDDCPVTGDPFRSYAISRKNLLAFKL